MAHRKQGNDGAIALLGYDLGEGSAGDMFGAITALVQTVLGVPMAAVSLLDRNPPSFKSTLIAVDGAPAINETLNAIALRGHRPLIVPDTMLDPRFSDDPQVIGNTQIRSYLGVPLISGEGVSFGTIWISDTVPRHFDDKEVGLLQDFARLVVEQLELREVAGCDPLTGALTRRGFYNAVEKDFSRAQRYERSASLLFFDIDHFRRINESFGTGIGDDALRAVAARCGDVCRQSDVFGRIGGQEFALLLPETCGEDALQFAERIRAIIGRMTFRAGITGFSLTASFGVAALSPAISTAAQWFGETDIALYEAKRLGRNRCVLATRPKLSEVRQDGNGTIEAAAATIVH